MRQTTLIEGDGALEIGKRPICTGVTAILPHSRNLIDEPVEATNFVFNGAGTSCGLSLIDEFGQIETPILLTNTFSVGAVYDAVTRYLIRTAFKDGKTPRWFSPTVGEIMMGASTMGRDCISQPSTSSRQSCAPKAVASQRGMWAMAQGRGLEDLKRRLAHHLAALKLRGRFGWWARWYSPISVVTLLSTVFPSGGF